MDALKALPPILLVPVPLFAFFVVFYKTVAPRFETEKQRAYVLSCLSSLVMTLSSLPFMYGYLTGGMERVWYMGNNGWSKVFADCVIAFFATYLFGEFYGAHVCHQR